MGNFYLDNDDMQFLFDHLDVKHLAGIMEDDFSLAQRFDDAPRDAEQAVEKYRGILTELGATAADEIAPTAQETDEIGNTLNPDGSVTYAPGIRKALSLLSASKLMGLTLPYTYGGQNCPALMLTMTNDIISRADASLMNLYGLQGIGETINAFADQAIKEQYLPQMASGTKTGAMVLTEPNAGSDLQSVKVTATEADDGTWRINGVKRFITNGCGDVLLVMARSEPDITDGRGLSLFLIEKGDGVRVRRIENKLGIHGSPTCELEFTNAKGTLIGERQQGLIKYVMALMYGARLGIAAQSCGIGEAAYRVARQYAHERFQFGTAIESFPAIRQLLVDSRIDLMAARALTYYTATCVDIQNGAEWKLAQDDFDSDEAKRETKQRARTYKKIAGMLTPMSKYFASEMCMRVAMNGISVMGGNGYMHDYPLERHLRDSRITTIYEGTTQLQIVPSVSAVASGIADQLIETLMAQDWTDDVRPLVDQLTHLRAELTETVAFIKDHDDANYRRLYARKLVDMAITVIIGLLFTDHAMRSDERKAVAKYWLDTRTPMFNADKQAIYSGNDAAYAQFEALAGPLPAAEPVMA
jgi:alkylation response protein AidB-like acyl-CoA dehydrogenase